MGRIPVHVTIDSAVVRQLEAYRKENGLRSRSRAAEILLRKILQKKGDGDETD